MTESPLPSSPQKPPGLGERGRESACVDAPRSPPDSTPLAKSRPWPQGMGPLRLAVTSTDPAYPPSAHPAVRSSISYRLVRPPSSHPLAVAHALGLLWTVRRLHRAGRGLVPSVWLPEHAARPRLVASRRRHPDKDPAYLTSSPQSSPSVPPPSSSRQPLAHPRHELVQPCDG